MRRFWLYVIVVLFFVQVAIGDVRLAKLVSDGMVLQQQSKVAIWGWADVGEKIEVRPIWQKDGVKTVAGKDGKWKVQIKTGGAGGPFAIGIKGNNEIIIKDVWVGEVWVCSGQSNMRLKVSRCDNAESEIAAANWPGIKLFQVKGALSDEPLEDCQGKWKSCDPNSVKDFSAAGYYFGRSLYEKLGVPVGLIQASWGGTPAEAWTSKEALEGDRELKVILEKYGEMAVDSKKNIDYHYRVVMKKWKKLCEEAKKNGTQAPVWPAEPVSTRSSSRPGCLYNGMISPLLNYGIKGVIWYQGESNAARAWQYKKLFPVMVKDWRKRWGQGDFGFYYVQIAPFDYYYHKNIFTGAELREAQRLSLGKLKNVGMAVTMDIGNLKDVHPTNKQEVGRRLAAIAFAKDYGFKDVAYSGPMYKKMKVEGGKVRLFFDYADGGLIGKDGVLGDFVVAGADEKFYPGQAKIDGETIVVWSDEVAKPKAVRFGWSNKSDSTFFNKAGLPASSFKTDGWDWATKDEVYIKWIKY